MKGVRVARIVDVESAGAGAGVDAGVALGLVRAVVGVDRRSLAVAPRSGVALLMSAGRSCATCALPSGRASGTRWT